MHILGTCEKRTAAQWRLPKKTCFARKENRNLALRMPLFSQVPKKCTDLDLSLLYILILGTYSEFTGKIISLRSAFAFRSPARALAAGLPRQDQVYKFTDESFRLHNQKFDEMRFKLESNENPRSFAKHPTPL